MLATALHARIYDAQEREEKKSISKHKEVCSSKLL